MRDDRTRTSNMQHYQILRSLKSALYGDVVLANCEESKKAVAIKRVRLANALRKQSLTGNRIKEDAEAERQVMSKLSAHGGHPNVLRMMKDFVEDGFLYLVLEYCSKGELYGLIEEAPNSRFSEEQAKIWFHQIVSGVNYIHSMGVAHRDISLENVLVDENDVCKVCDFGLSASAYRTHSDSVGKFFYMAPEVYAAAEYDAIMADIWSLGIVLFIMLTGFPPTEIPSSQDDRFRLIKSKGVRALLRAWKMDSWFSETAADLLDMILRVNPVHRPSINDILRHPWFADINAEEHMDVDEMENTFVTEDEEQVTRDLATVTINFEERTAKKAKVLKSIQRERPGVQIFDIRDVHSKQGAILKIMENAHQKPASSLDSSSGKNMLISLKDKVEAAKLWEAYQHKKSILREAWKSSCPWNPMA